MSHHRSDEKGFHTMQQPQYKSNFELKFLARVQTGQYLGILVGAILLKFAITFMAVNLVSSLFPASNAAGFVVNYIAVFGAQVAASVLNVGTSYIFLKSACGMQSTIRDLFCGFQENTAKILKIGAVIAVIESICMIPLEIASAQYAQIIISLAPLGGSNVNELSFLLAGNSMAGSEFLESYSILYNASMKFYLIMFVCTVISLILTLPFFPAFYMVLDFPDWSATTILKKSFEVMNGHKVRLFLLYVSFVPAFLLSIFTCGITLIWVVPYQNMAMTNLYLDIMSVRNKTADS